MADSSGTPAISHKAVLVAIAVYLLIDVVAVGLSLKWAGFLVADGYPPIARFLLCDAPLAWLVIAVALWFTQLLHGSAIRESVGWLGFAKPDSRQLIGGLAIFITLAGTACATAIMSGANLHLRPSWYAVLLFVLTVPALSEEIGYRGFVFGNLRLRMGLLPALLLSSAIFTASHVNVFVPGTYESFVLGRTVVVLIGTFAAGFLLGWIYELGGRSIWPCVLGHLGNSISMVYGLKYPAGTPVSFLGANRWWLDMVIGLLLTSVVAWVFLRRYALAPAPGTHGDMA